MATAVAAVAMARAVLDVIDQDDDGMVYGCLMSTHISEADDVLGSPLS